MTRSGLRYRPAKDEMESSLTMTRLLSRRMGNLAGFLACAGMLAFGYYLQFAVGLEPCPLCIIQRILLFAAGVAFLLAALHHPAARLGAGLYGGGVPLLGGTGGPGGGGHACVRPP